MTVESEADRATILADFGETFRVSPGAVWPNKSDLAADITAIFDSEYLAVFGDGTETSSKNPVAFARASDLVGVVRNSVMVRASDQAEYKVVKIEPDGTGMTILELEGPIMADLRAEQIMAAITTALTGLTTTGANVQRAQIYPHEETKLPAIAIFIGDDVPDNDLVLGLTDWSLTVLVESTVKIAADYTGQGTTLETSLAEIRKEVHVALLADHTLGLAFVLDVIPGPAQKPIVDGGGDVPIGSQVIQFEVSYRSSRADPSA